MNFLHIEDSPDDRALIKAHIERTAHWKYSWVDNLAEGIARIQDHHPEVVLVDLSLPRTSREEILRTIRAYKSKTCILVVSGDDRQDVANECYVAGAVLFINKNKIVSPNFLHDAVIESVKRNLTKGQELEGPNGIVLERLMEAVFYGNGKPSIMARLESGGEQMKAIDGKVDELKKIGESRKLEVDSKFTEINRKLDDDRKSDSRKTLLLSLMPFFATFLYFILQFYALQKGSQHEARPLSPSMEPPSAHESEEGREK